MTAGGKEESRMEAVGAAVYTLALGCACIVLILICFIDFMD